MTLTTTIRHRWMRDYERYDRLGDSYRRRPEQGLRINHRIRVPEIRVIFEEEQLGIMPTHEALRLASEEGPRSRRDLATRASRRCAGSWTTASTSTRRRRRSSRRASSASTVETKEIKFRPKTEGHDMDFKVKHVRRFLEGGNKVRLAVVFRGREITHPQTGMNVLESRGRACADIATVEATPNMEGRRMIMVIAPKPGVVRKAQEAQEGPARRASGRAGRKEGPSVRSCRRRRSAGRRGRSRRRRDQRRRRRRRR